MPSLLAWPTLAMDPAPASVILSCLLFGTYVVDKRFSRRGMLPFWYMGLRLPLTLLSSFGMLTTASYFVHKENQRLEAVVAARDLEQEQASAAAAAQPQ